MGHLLATVNKEAADDIENPHRNLPDIGTRVVYGARAGFQRQGRTEFPADVMGINRDGSLSLFVTMGQEDQIVEDAVRERTHNEPHHYWRRIVDNQVNAEISHLSTELEVLKHQVHGDFEVTDKSIIDHLNDFDERLRALTALM